MTTELTPSLVAAKDQLMIAVRRDYQRRQSRRRLIRTGVIGFAAFAALSGSALAAGDALNLINLGGGATAAPVSTVPVWNSSTGTFSSGVAGGQYIYELTNVPGAAFACGPATPVEADYITATRPLSQAELQGMLDANNSLGLSDANATALGVTSTGGGCFPASIAGESGVPGAVQPGTSSGATSSDTVTPSGLLSKFRQAQASSSQTGAPTKPSPGALAKASSSLRRTNAAAPVAGGTVVLKRAVIRKDGKVVGVIAFRELAKR